jgi:hypothetical protein
MINNCSAKVNTSGLPSHQRPTDLEARATETFDRLLAAWRRGARHEAQKTLMILAALGYRAESLAGGWRLVSVRAGDPR